MPQNLKNQKNNFLGCRFSKKIFDRITKEEKAALEQNLRIDLSKDSNGDFFEAAKPSNSISPSEVFKLNQKMLIR